MAEVAASSNIVKSVSPRSVNDIPAWQKSANEAPPNSNLIVNYLPPNYSEANLFELFSPYGPILHYKIVKNLETSRSMGYGFVQFADSQAAKAAMDALNGYHIQNKQLKVSVARPASSEIKRSNLYIIGLPLTWTKQDLVTLFSPYGEVVESRILTDTNTRQSRGVGFCRLGSNAAALRAIDAVNGTIPNGGTAKLTIKIADNPNHMRRNNHGVMSPQCHANVNPLSPQAQAQSQNHILPNFPQQSFKPVDYRHYPYSTSYPYQQPNQIVPPNFPYNNKGLNNNNMSIPPMNIGSMNSLPNNGMSGMTNMNNITSMGMVAPASPNMHPLHSNGMNGINAPPLAPNQYQGYCLFVYHLPLDVTDQALYELFSQYAHVTSTKVMKDMQTGRSKGFGFVNVMTEQDGLHAIQNLNSHKIGNKYIKVSFKSNKMNAAM